MTVILRSHGGLGNQIFQILFARLCAQCLDEDYAELHDASYEHKFARSQELLPAPTMANKWQQLVSELRIPKVLLRLRLRKAEVIAVFGDTFLDGYFQRVSDFDCFSDVQVADQIEQLRTELKIKQHDGSNQSVIYHLRLGDFFRNKKDAVAHALSCISDVQPGSTIITNQEDIFMETAVRQHLLEKMCVLHSTQKYTSEEVLRLMSSYGRIVTNNSTLAFWASVLGNSRTEFTDSRLSSLHDRLFRLANAR
jgi:hypothetical protein